MGEVRSQTEKTARPFEPTREVRSDSLSPRGGAGPVVGDRIGKYVVERLLGSGGMGIVVAARHEQLGESVAIKLLHPKASQDQVQVERFVREARATVRIKSEHVVRVLDAGVVEDSGAPYLVMEFLTGTDLGRMLKVDGPLPYPQAVHFVLQACEAVAAAHALGIVHRDLKPSNFFLTQGTDGVPLVKVLDFGISKALHQDGEIVDPKLTETQAVFGSPTYMSPEQIRSAKHVDQRADIWSLGVALFELLTGKLPFMADNVAGLLASIVADPPFQLRAFRADVPEELERIVYGCLEKDPARRIPTVAHLAAYLLPFAPPEAATLCTRIDRISNGGHTTTGPHLSPLSRHPVPPPSPSMSGPPPLAFGTTGTDLSASAPANARGGRSVMLAVVSGLLAGTLILGVGAALAIRARGGFGRGPVAAAPVEGPALPTPASAAPPVEPAPSSAASAPPATTPSASAAASGAKVSAGKRHPHVPAHVAPPVGAPPPPPVRTDTTDSRY